MQWKLFVAFLAGYLFLDWASYIHPLAMSSITPWNPQPALAVGLLLLAGQRWLPAVVAAVLLAEVIVRGAPAGLAASLLVAVVLALAYAAMAVALSRGRAAGSRLDTARDMGRLIAVVAIGSLVAGALYVGALWSTGAPLPGSYVEAMLQFWIGDCVGILISLPLVLVLADPVRRAELRSVFARPLAFLQAAAVALALWVVFASPAAQPLKLFYLLFLPIIWIAVWFGLVGSILGTLGIQVGVIAAVQYANYPSLTVFELQALLIALTVTGLFLGVVVDQRRRAAEDLRTSLRLAAAGEMSAALAHELNQPLTALTSYARAARLLAEDRERDRAQLVDTLQKVLGEAERAADVVRRLRDFFRQREAHLQPASLPDLARTVVEGLRQRSESAGVAVESAALGSVPAVLADPVQIEVVLRNLVANGLEAAMLGPEPRRVRVEIAAEDGRFVEARVRDTGPGVDPAMRERVFEPFWSSRSSGMGMGLAISRAIVEAHGGRLWVETPGHGEFAFTLPTAHG